MSAEKKRKAGRPVVVGEGAIVANVRLSREQYQRAVKASQRDGKRLSEWLREAVSHYAQAA